MLDEVVEEDFGPRVVVVTLQAGQLAGVSVRPTAIRRQARASLAETAPLPPTSQTQSSQVSRLTPTLRMNRQSAALGLEPVVEGWEQSPWAAAAGPAAPAMARRQIKRKQAANERNPRWRIQVDTSIRGDSGGHRKASTAAIASA